MQIQVHRLWGLWPFGTLDYSNRIYTDFRSQNVAMYHIMNMNWGAHFVGENYKNYSFWSRRCRFYLYRHSRASSSSILNDDIRHFESAIAMGRSSRSFKSGDRGARITKSAQAELATVVHIPYIVHSQRGTYHFVSNLMNVVNFVI